MPLLATKLFVPRPRPGLVARPRLIERFNEALSSPLVLLSAPAGFGKTTILAQWIACLRPPRPVAWISLDEGDNEPARFWDYVLAGLRTLKPGIGETASSVLRSFQSPPIESGLISLINDLSETRGALLLVLDDYHLINNEAIHKGVAFLIEHAPPEMNLVISTRVDPNFPLARLRGRGSMFEVRADDLRFTVDEATSLLAEQRPPDLSIEDVNALYERTEGWAVGLKLAALSTRGQGDVRAFIAAFTGSQRHVMEYLIEEVLQKQAPEVRDFLLKTSVLERLSAPLCDYVVQQNTSEDMLAKLETNFGGFLVPLDEAREWYRYHHLIAELMRHQLERTFESEQTRQLHLRASEWYEGHGHHDNAIDHRLKIRDWERATGLVASAADALIKRGEWNTLSGWFEAIPAEVLRVHLRAYAHYANVLTTLGRLEAAEPVLAYLEGMIKLEESLRGQLAFFRMSVAYHRGDHERTKEQAEKALEQLDEKEGAMRARALHLLGLFDMDEGRLARAELREVEAARTAQRVGESWVGVTAAGNLSLILLRQGRLRQAFSNVLQSGAGAYVLGLLYYERNELDDAARHAQQIIEGNELTGYAEGRIATYNLFAKTLLAKGDVPGAEAAMLKADDVSRLQGVSPHYRATHAANRVMFAIRRGDLAAAVDWGNRLSSLPLDALLFYQHVPARLLIARGQNVVAAELLRGPYDRAMHAEAQSLAITIRVCQALAATSHDEGLAFLADALRAGEPEGFIRTFADEGGLLAPLLRKALARGITPEYTSMLLAIIEAEERRRKTQAGGPPASKWTGGLLSEREMEVLRLVAQGMSDRQVASKLMISLSTTKTHVHRILEKLNTTSRTQAAARARSINLI